jgi:NADPH:quinone reductase-like Zn-dependent oxidoreductase
MKAVLFDQFGPPEEVLHLGDRPVPEPGPGEVRVRMLASPVNPSDLLYVRGEYGKQPTLPATPGLEGAGVVEASGGGLLARRVMGRRVAVLNPKAGNWQEQVIIPARQAVPVPAELTDEQAATFFVNPASAIVMTQYILRVPRGAWLAQSAAGSALGRMVIRLGKMAGFHTINLVRRKDQADELLRAGGDAVVCTAEESIADRILALTHGVGAPFALDAVGGTTGTELARSLAPGGRLVVYGTLSEEPLQLSPRVLMAGQKSVEGFWLSEWTRAQGILSMLGLFRRIGKLLRAGVVTTEVGTTFPLAEVRAAVRQAATPGRHGKVLLKISS